MKYGSYLSPGGNGPMTVPMERVENRILTIRGHRRLSLREKLGCCGAVDMAAYA